MSFQGRQNTIIPASSISDVPNSLLSKRLYKSMPSRNQIVEVSASNGNVQNSSGTISFNIGTGGGAGYMKSGSAYLRFDFNLEGANSTTYNFNGTTGHQSCASLIKTMNINIGGLQLEQVNDYDKYYRIVQAHACNANYVEHDVQITESSSSTAGTGMVTQVSPNPPTLQYDLTFCVPILSGVLNQDNHIPLFLLNSQMQIQLNLNSAVEALYGASAPTNFTIRDPVLVYEKIHCDGEFENAVKMKLSEGSVYEIPYYSALSYRSSSSSAGTFSQNIGVNLSSLSAVLWTHVLLPTDGTNAKLFVAKNDNTKAGSRRVVRCDGEQILQSQVYSPAQVFMELQRSLGSILDTNQTTIATLNNFATDYWVNGQSTERFSDDHLCMKGKSVNNVVVEEQGVTGTVSTVYMYLVYNSVLMIQADGSAIVSK